MYFGTGNPIGRRIKLRVDGPQSPGAPPPEWVTIVGITPTVRQRMLPGDDVPDPVAYIPLRGHAPSFMMLLIRAQRDAASLTSLARDEVRAIDPDLPLFGVLTMDQQLAQQRWPFRIFGTMFVIFALIALALSAVGLYAVTAYSVSQRTQEIGVRMALGAQAAQVMWLILRRSIVQMTIGLTLGIAGALGVSKLLSSAVPDGKSRSDPVDGDRLAAHRRVDGRLCLAARRRATRSASAPCGTTTTHCRWPADFPEPGKTVGSDAAALTTRKAPPDHLGVTAGGPPTIR